MTFACPKEPKLQHTEIDVFKTLIASYQSRPFLLLFSKHRPPVGTHTFCPSPPCHLGPGCWRRWSRLNAALGRRRLERQASSRSPEVLPNWLTSGPLRLVGNLAAWFGASLALNRPLTCCFQSRTCRSPGPLFTCRPAPTGVIRRGQQCSPAPGEPPRLRWVTRGNARGDDFFCNGFERYREAETLTKKKKNSLRVDNKKKKQLVSGNTRS